RALLAAQACMAPGLGGGRGDRAPAAGALLHIRIIALGVVAIVPGGRGGLDVDLGRWGDDDRWDVIRPPVRPIRVPVRPDGHPEARPDEARATMAQAVPAMAKTMATGAPATAAAVSTPPRVPWYCADHEQRYQQPEQYHPPPPRARGLVPTVHHDLLPLLITPYAGPGRRPFSSSQTPQVRACRDAPPFSDTPPRYPSQPSTPRG